MLKKSLLVLVVIVLAFLGFVALQPSEFRVERGIKIDAPPEIVFAQVNDFHSWEAWSPWTKLDPQAKNSFEGPAAGAGAIFHWSGNDQVGEGTMTLTESKPSSLIRIQLEFRKPWAGTSAVEFTFKPEGEQTAVSWSMSGRNNFVSKLFCLFMNMDKMVGGDYEKGLANMKSVAEAAVKK